ncbi:hypothetical protein [Rhodospirillum sp. A1_3_36]|uniref:hypothetical protein n=1 Tax=Rhodospirillum sp. A1_3_36 TaxID=3391666 RepID=UPI0039A5D65D
MRKGPSPIPGWTVDKLLKADLFSKIELGRAPELGDRPVVRRDIGHSRWWVRPLALWLGRNEGKALKRLGMVDWAPALLSDSGGDLYRAWIDGHPMWDAQPRDPAYYAQAFRLLRKIHRLNIAHNDLAKEPNWLVRPDGSPALIDFQIASTHKARSWWFRTLAREDLRHLLKHKRKYCPEAMTAREWAIVKSPSPASRLWRKYYKGPYLFITRKILHWSDREGAHDRSFVEAEAQGKAARRQFDDGGTASQTPTSPKTPDRT